MKSKKDIFLLIDSHAIIHRAYHAIPATVQTSKGLQVNAVYGFTSILLEVLKKFEPKYIICAFDSKGPTVRKQKYKDYKAQRKEIDKELKEQFPIVREVVEAFDIPIFEVEGYEADDILGTLAAYKINQPRIEKIIVTGDQDILQLIQDNVKVYKSGSRFSQSKLFGREEMITKYKFAPEHMIDYKALRGDPSDNIPGVKGVGDKTATALIEQFGHLEDIYKNIDKITSKSVRSKLHKDKEIAFLSKELATIYKDIPLKFSLEDAKLTTLNIDKIKDKFMDLEFQSLIRKIPKLESMVNGQIDLEEKNMNFSMFDNKKEDNLHNQYQILKDPGQIESFLENLSKQKIFAFDTETTGLDFINCDVMGISFCWEPKQAYYIDFSAKISQEHIQKLKNIFENPDIKKIAHNMKFDAHTLCNSTFSGEKLGFSMQGYYFDTMIAAYVLTGARKGIGLKKLAFTDLKMQLASLEDVWASASGLKIKKQPTKQEIKEYMISCDRRKLGMYACADADATFRLFKLYKDKIDEMGFSRLFWDIEMPLVSLLMNIERNGVVLDIQYLQELGNELSENIKELEKKVYEIVGHEFNISSPKQVGEVLFDELDLGLGKKTKTGSWQTNDRILKSLYTKHEVVPMIIQHRELSKLYSTYIDSLISQVDLQTGKLHTSYNQAVTTTGRLSSSSPNLQNIPVATEIGMKIRKAFVASEGFELISFDFSQQELRILAHMSGEDSLINAFANNQDVHQLTASKIFDLPFCDVTSQMRSKGKTLNFSLIYGISAFGLSERMGISRQQAQELIDSYFQTYPKVRLYFDKILDEAFKTGRVETLFGRYRDTQGLKSSNHRIKSATQREVINFPIQGTAADQIKIAMNKCFDYLQTSSIAKRLEARMILQVHDEIIFEVKKDMDISDFVVDITKLMENAVSLDVKMKVDYKKALNWSGLK